MNENNWVDFINSMTLDGKKYTYDKDVNRIESVEIYTADKKILYGMIQSIKSGKTTYKQAKQQYLEINNKRLEDEGCFNLSRHITKKDIGKTPHDIYDEVKEDFYQDVISEYKKGNLDEFIETYKRLLNEKIDKDFVDSKLSAYTKG